MATARVSRKFVMDRAENLLVYIASERSAEREKFVSEYTKPEQLWTGNYRIRSVEEAKKQFGYERIEFHFRKQEKLLQSLYNLAEMAKGDLTISKGEADALYDGE